MSRVDRNKILRNATLESFDSRNSDVIHRGPKRYRNSDNRHDRSSSKYSRKRSNKPTINAASELARSISGQNLEIFSKKYGVKDKKLDRMSDEFLYPDSDEKSEKDETKEEKKYMVKVCGENSMITITGLVEHILSQESQKYRYISCKDKLNLQSKVLQLFAREKRPRYYKVCVIFRKAAARNEIGFFGHGTYMMSVSKDARSIKFMVTGKFNRYYHLKIDNIKKMYISETYIKNTKNLMGKKKPTRQQITNKLRDSMTRINSLLSQYEELTGSTIAVKKPTKLPTVKQVKKPIKKPIKKSTKKR